MKQFTLFALVLMLASCNLEYRQKAARLNEELAATPLLSIQFDSLIQEARGLPDQNRLTVLLPAATRKGEGWEGAAKLEPLLLEALPLASKVERKKILLSLIDCYSILCHYSNSVSAEEKGLIWYEELKNNYTLSKHEEWEVKKQAALLYYNKNLVAESLSIFYELLSEYRTEGEYRLLVENLQDIGAHYVALGDQEKALSFALEAYQLAVDTQIGEMRIDAARTLVRHLSEAGRYAEAVACAKENGLNASPSLTFTFCYSMANCYLKMGHPDTARFYLNASRKLMSEQMDHGLLYARIAETYIAENREDSVIFFVEESMAYYRKRVDQRKQSGMEKRLPFPPIITPIYTSYALLLQRNGKPEKAQEVYRLVEPLTEMNSGYDISFHLQADALFHMASFYRDMGHYKDATDLLLRRDSILQMSEKEKTERNTKAILDRFKSQELISNIQLQKVELQASRRVLILMGTFGLLLVGCLVVLFLLYRHGRRQLSALLQLKAEVGQAKAEQAKVTEEPNAMRELFTLAEEKVASGKLFLNKELSLEALAHELETNRSYLSACINSCSGCNFSQWINNFRINYILAHLHDANDLSKLIDESGFVSRASFYRNFKQHTRLTPGQYLEEVQKKKTF